MVMAFIIVVFGASGSGKSTLLERVAHAGFGYGIHMKKTTRAEREYDGVEIDCVPVFSPRTVDYVYQTYGHRYLIERWQIEEAVARNEHHFVICNDIDTIKSLRRDFSPLVRVIFLHFDAPEAELARIQTERGISDDEIRLRLGKMETLYRVFVEQPEFFDGVIYNRFGTATEEMWTQIRRLLVQFTVESEAKRLEAAVLSAVEIVKQQFPERERAANTAIERGYVFILMAMIDDDPMLCDIHEAIRSVCERFELVAERVDDMQYRGTITEKVKGSIQRAEFLIADLTHNRPNVYYEIGYAEALGKEVILTARRDTEPHFDVQNLNILFYANLSELTDLLGRSVAACLEDVRSS